MSLVHIVEDGERAQMSKRSGDFVSLDELLDDIGVDATRWFMLWRSHETTVDLDLELARSQSSENPVYYVQYAHARIASILRKAGAAGEEAAAGLDPEAPRGGARAEREGADQAPARVPRRGPRVGRAPGAAPDLRLLDRGRRRLPRLLPRLPGGRRRGRGGRALAAGALPLRRSGRSPRRSGCSGSPPPSGCDARRAPQAARPGRDLRPGARRERGPGRCAAPTSRRSPGCSERLAAHRVVLVTGDEGAGRRRSRSPGPPAPPGARTALVECDLARPRLAADLGLAADAGPARVPALGGDRAGDPAAAGPRRPGRARGAPTPLVCVAAGRPAPDPATLLDLESFRHALAKLRSAYDLVVLAGPGARRRPAARWRRSRRRPTRSLAAVSPQRSVGPRRPRCCGPQLRRAAGRRRSAPIVVGAASAERRLRGRSGRGRRRAARRPRRWARRRPAGSSRSRRLAGAAPAQHADASAITATTKATIGTR